ncbi:MAG TPA: SGNH/GDSL hydrolase family protein [Pyrinomonadaceae bacterium]|jgi:lysophospholipase L1-like esterase|nr:SGNH/GDSL hydrolase family protein [Pyrinomonadaceae bacterium]
MKVVILADSLALPRQAGEGNIPFEATYPYLLDESLRGKLAHRAPLIIERGMRSRTIERVLDEWFEMVQLRGAEVVVVHIGIVDCAPRVLMPRERAFVERLRPARLRVRFLDFIHRHRRRIVQTRGRVYVPVLKFKAGVEEVVRRAREARVRSLVFINIIEPPPEMEERSPGFRRNVEDYNRILRAQAAEQGVHLIDLDNLIREHGGPEELTVDGIHINHTGHKMLAQELERHILGLLEDEMTAAQAVSKI